MKLVDMTGQVFGRLTVLRYERLSPGKHNGRWICRCVCGVVKKISRGSLVSGASGSCGCLSRELTSKRSKKEGSHLRSIYRVYKTRARDNNIEFKLSIEELYQICTKNCYFCKDPPTQPASFHKKYTGEFNSHGIDRFDNNKGYTLENSVPCCKHCNRMKRDHTPEQFKNHVIKIYNEWASK